MSTEATKPAAAELVAEIKALTREKPTAQNGYGIKLWSAIEVKLTAALAATGTPQGVRDALEVARGHLDMSALRVSHCNDAALIDSALAAQGAAPVVSVAAFDRLQALADSQAARILALEAAPAEPWNGLKGLPTLHAVIGLLRETGRYVDEEGESTDSLDDLAAWVEQQATAAAAPAGLAAQLATAVAAIEDDHDPFCMSVLRGKECSCGRGAAPAGAGGADLSQIEIAGLTSSVGHLSALLDVQSTLLARAMAAMKALEESAAPANESRGDFDCLIPEEKWATFVDTRATLLHDVARSPVATPQQPAEAAPAVKESLTTAAPCEIDALQVDVESLSEAEKYLRDEADFNRSWTDGRRGSDLSPSAEYIARRLHLADERSRWADAIARAKTGIGGRQ